jgi:aryl-alcohol dehydrogenase-like predicted oxidoreductase
MEFTMLGNSGLAVSRLGLGCNNLGGRLDLEQSRAVVHKALDLGVTFLDVADIYGHRGGSETALGEILGPRRKDIVLASKFGKRMDRDGLKMGASPAYIVEALEASLKRLKTDWLDLYQLHEFDPHTPIIDTLAALGEQIRAGKVRHVGCSNLPAWRVAEAHYAARDIGIEGFISMQEEYSLLVRDAERDLIDVANHYRMGFLPFFPLASGLLTGKYRLGQEAPPGTRLADLKNMTRRYFNDANLAKVETLIAFAEARGRTLLELAMSWLMLQPVVSSLIAGASTPAQMQQNAEAATWKMSADDLAELDRLTKPH